MLPLSQSVCRRDIWLYELKLYVDPLQKKLGMNAFYFLANSTLYNATPNDH